MQCANHFRQVGLAFHNYHDAQRTFPPGSIFSHGQTAGMEPDCSPPLPGINSSLDYYVGFGWGIFVLPYMEEENLYDRFDFSKSLFPATGNPWASRAEFQAGSDKD